MITSCPMTLPLADPHFRTNLEPLAMIASSIRVPAPTLDPLPQNRVADDGIGADAAAPAEDDVGADFGARIDHNVLVGVHRRRRCRDALAGPDPPPR